MSPTLDPEDCPGPSRGTPGGGFGIFNPDGSRAVPASTSMVSYFNWDTTDHPQARVRIGEVPVSVDAKIAPMIFLLNQVGVSTVTSCQGDDRQWGYVMIADVRSALRFLRLWYWRLVPRGYPLPVLDFELRDEDWRQEVGADFPFPASVSQDPAGFSFTAVWKLYHEELEELMPDMLDALRREAAARLAATPPRGI